MDGDTNSNGGSYWYRIIKFQERFGNIRREKERTCHQVHFLPLVVLVVVLRNVTFGTPCEELGRYQILSSF